MCMCMYVYIYIYIYIYMIYITCYISYITYISFFFVVTHRVFHTRLPGVCSDGRPESLPESVKRSDA